MKNKSKFLKQMVNAMAYSVIGVIIASVIITWSTFIISPDLWERWNILTLPFEFYIECGILHPVIPMLYVTFLVMVLLNEK